MIRGLRFTVAHVPIYVGAWHGRPSDACAVAYVVGESAPTWIELGTHCERSGLHRVRCDPSDFERMDVLCEDVDSVFYVREPLWQIGLQG